MRKTSWVKLLHLKRESVRRKPRSWRGRLRRQGIVRDGALLPGAPKLNMRYVVGVDIGGTFTDCVVVDENGRVSLGKSLSTPDDFAVGAIDAARDAARNIGLNDEAELIRSARVFFYSCTIGENTPITRTRAKTA